MHLAYISQVAHAIETGAQNCVEEGRETFSHSHCVKAQLVFALSAASMSTGKQEARA